MQTAESLPSTNIETQVEAISSRPAGRGTAYSFKGSDNTWYGLGFKEPTFAKGDFVKFDCTKSGNYNNVVPNTIIILEKVPAGKPELPEAGVKKEPGYWDNKDKAIGLGAARKASLEFVDLAIRNGAVPYDKVAVKDRLELLEKLVERYTAYFYLCNEAMIKNESSYIETLAGME